MKLYLLVLMLLLSACNSTPKVEQTPTKMQAKPESAESRSLLFTKNVYFFQHKILPEWTFTTNGGFYLDLLHGELSRLKLAATAVVAKEYADAISIEVLNKGEAVLIKFPEPKAIANCFYVLIQKADDEYKFFTYEKTMAFGDDDPVKGMVGQWSVQGNHANLGGRTYLNSSDFIRDILKAKG